MSTLRSRGEEVSVQVIVDGAQQSGSFTRVMDFKLTPREDLVDTDFLGETASQVDRQHHGYDFSFTTHESDNAAVNLLLSLVNQEANAQPYSQVTLVVIKKYRDPSLQPATLSLEECVVKLDSQDFGSRKDFIKNQWSGKARFMRSF